MKMSTTHLLALGLVFVIVFLSPQFLSQFSTPHPIPPTFAPTPTPSQSPQVQGAAIDPNAYSILEEPTFIVKRVVDGDTIELESGQTVRYIGIDTPETKHPSVGVECYGQEAYNKNKALVEGKAVVLESDVSQTDRYGRLLRYVYLEGQMVNETLVKEGYAQAVSFPPDIKYQDQLKAAEQLARMHKIGLWNEQCTVPSQVQISQTQQPTTPNSATPPGNCSIKGNINSSQQKIYHVHGCTDYDKTSIDVTVGEQWFCTEQDAIQAGWRKAKNC